MNPELAQIEAFGKEILKRVMAEEEPADMRQWMTDTLAHMGGAGENAAMTWEESFDLVDRMLDEYAMLAATPPEERRVLAWPWASWNKMIDNLEEGMLADITAPDGMGKTIYGEMIAEYWAQHKNHVVFVHYELNRKLMMLRRTARHTSILARAIKDGKLSSDERGRIAESSARLRSWDGCITYLHTPGWTMERTIAELSRLRQEGKCDVVVLDYLEKVAASQRQIKMFGTNLYQREADNVEQLKNFAEGTGVPVVQIMQMNKEGKKTGFDNVDRTGIRGAGEKTEKANLVVMMTRERTAEGYSPVVDVLVDKNTMGGTGTFQQLMQPEYFRVADLERRMP